MIAATMGYLAHVLQWMGLCAWELLKGLAKFIQLKAPDLVNHVSSRLVCSYGY